MLTTVGCTSTYGGGGLNSANYLNDEVVYYPPGPETKLANESATMKAAAEESAAQQQGAVEQVDQP